MEKQQPQKKILWISWAQWVHATDNSSSASLHPLLILIYEHIAHACDNGFRSRDVPAVQVRCDFIMSRYFLQHFLYWLVHIHLKVCAVMALVNVFYTFHWSTTLSWCETCTSTATLHCVAQTCCLLPCFLLEQFFRCFFVYKLDSHSVSSLKSFLGNTYPLSCILRLDQVCHTVQ